MSKTDDISNRPTHEIRFPIDPDGITQLRQVVTEGIGHFPPGPEEESENH
jgi:hypothetical protein